MKRTWVYLIISISILSVNVGIIGPLLISGSNLAWANGLYLAVRLGTLIALAYFLVKHCKKRRFQAITLVSFVAFLEQVPLKGWSIYRDSLARPDIWQGVTVEGLAVQLMVSYVAMVPIIFVLAFFGTELSLGRRGGRRDGDAGLSHGPV